MHALVPVFFNRHCFISWLLAKAFRPMAALFIACNILLINYAAAAVGRLPGVGDVTSTGAATYVIPISVPAGMNGLKPEISLAYNSQSGDGLAGVGWTLEGFSKITRCDKKIYVDGAVSGVTNTPSDRFCMDDAPLIMITPGGTYGANNVEYRPELHDYQKVVSKGAQGTGPSYFEVQLRNGLKYVYGNDSDSRILAAGTIQVKVWALNSIEDKYGNKVNFAYSNPAVGEFVPDAVTWTSGAGIVAPYKLQFTYEDLGQVLPSAKRSGYLAGSQWQATRRLKYVDYSFNANLTHRYTLNYEASNTGKSRLTSVQICDGTGSNCLPATTMSWQGGANGFGEIMTGPTTTDFAKRVFGDYNGDGATDIFVPVNGLWKVMLADVTSGNLGSPSNLVPSRQYYENKIAGGIAIEFDGDGLADLMAEGADGMWHVYLGSGSGCNSGDCNLGFQAGGAVTPLDINGDGLTDFLQNIWPGNASPYVVYRLNSGSVLAAAVQVSGLDSVVTFAPLGYKTADYNGDGKHDLLAQKSVVAGPDAGFYIFVYLTYLNTSVNPARFDFAPIEIDFGANQPTGPTSADINGDGLDDILYYLSGQWHTQISRGTGFDAAIATGISSTNATPIQIVSVLSDISGDGRSDLLGSCGASFCAFTSDGNSYSASRYFTVGNLDPVSVTNVNLQDTNADGIVDFLAVKTANPANGWVVRGNSEQHDLLVSVTDGLGNVFAPSYHTLSNWPHDSVTGQGYTADGAGNLPVSHLIRGSSMRVVSQVERNTGMGTSTYTNSYAYWNAKQNMRGLGFLGFEKVNQLDSRNQLLTESIYSQEYPLIGRLDKETVWNGNYKVSESDPSWMFQWPIPSGVADSLHSGYQYFFVHLNLSVDRTFEVDIAGGSLGQEVRKVARYTNLTGYPWNYQHGAPVREQVTETSPYSATIYTTTTDRDFSDLVSAWCLGLPSLETVRKENGAQSSERQVSYSYNSNCQVTTKTVGTGAKQLQTQYIYDPMTGRLTDFGSDVPNSWVPSRRALIEYDSVGYRQASLAQPVAGVDHVSTSTWDNALGLETNRINVQGESTSLVYDSFGRLVTETQPAGSATITYTSVNCSSCWYGINAKYEVKTQRSDGFWSKSYRDSYDREIAKSVKLITGESREKFAYDELGRISSKTIPYKSGDQQFNVNYTYDLIGRPKSESRQISELNSSTQSTNWGYSGLTTIITDAKGRAIEYVTDSRGLLREVHEPSPGATTIYEYTPWGELSSVTDAGQHTMTSITYDERGLKQQTIDVDAGTWTYEYNIWGELEKVRDARTSSTNWTLINTYDALGRLTQRDDFDPVTATTSTSTWEYYLSNYCCGQRRGLLYRARTYAGAVGSSSILYEQVSKYGVVAGTKVGVTEQITTISGAPQSSYTTNFAYDSEGRLSQMTYPVTVSSQRPRFDYTYTNGYLNTVKQYQNGLPSDRYDLIETDALGRETHVSLGTSALDVRSSYDKVSLLIKEIQSGPSLGASAQNLAYSWDQVGNLSSRVDKNQSGTPSYLTEDFVYDDLNRLKHVNRNGVSTTDVNYIPDGNITTKTMPDGYVNNYSYGISGKPHAVSSLTYSYACGCQTCANVSSFTYDANGNQLTRALNGTGNRWITWTAFSKPKQISVGSANCAGNCTSFTYGPNREIVKQVDKVGEVTRSIYYVGPHFEVEVTPTVTEYRSIALANGRSIYSQVEDTDGVGWAAYYPLRDHLGSLDRQYRAIGSGWQLLPYSFDAFGRRRNWDWSNDGSGSQMSADLWNHRGYTDHEMLDSAQLIHMQGRVYDPTLGRFLSPDPLLDKLNMPQSLNPYSYVANNPLAYTDPTGYGLRSFFKRLVRRWGRQIVAAAAAYYTAGWATAYANTAAYGQAVASSATVGATTGASSMATVVGGAAGGFVGGAISTGELKGAIAGGLTGAAFSGVGEGFNGKFNGWRVMADASVGGVAAMAQGGSFKQGFLSAGSMSGLTWAAIEMREFTVKQSRLAPGDVNASGVSDGFMGDHFKTAGCRLPCEGSWLGGIQGGKGMFFGREYAPGGFLDHLLEAYGGVHDALNSPFFYNALGQNRQGPLMDGLLTPVNWGNVVVATPFVAASVMPSYTYQFISNPE